MKVRVAKATGCPVPQFVVEAETNEDRVLLDLFTSFGDRHPREWMFHLHGYAHSCDHQLTTSFNFGWSRRPTRRQRLRWTLRRLWRRIT